MTDRLGIALWFYLGLLCVLGVSVGEGSFPLISLLGADCMLVKNPVSSFTVRPCPLSWDQMQG